MLASAINNTRPLPGAIALRSIAAKTGWPKMSSVANATAYGPRLLYQPAASRPNCVIAPNGPFAVGCRGLTNVAVGAVRIALCVHTEWVNHAFPSGVSARAALRLTFRNDSDVSARDHEVEQGGLLRGGEWRRDGRIAVLSSNHEDIDGGQVGVG